MDIGEHAKRLESEWDLQADGWADELDRNDADIFYRLEKGEEESVHRVRLVHVRNYSIDMENGNEPVDMITSSGIYVESSNVLGVVELGNEAYRGSIKRDRLYASAEQVLDLWANVQIFLDSVENKHVDFPRACAEACLSRQGPARVSVEGLGEYFNEYEHDPTTKLCKHYNSDQKLGGARPQIRFIKTGQILVEKGPADIRLEPQRNWSR